MVSDPRQPALARLYLTLRILFHDRYSAIFSSISQSMTDVLHGREMVDRYPGLVLGQYRLSSACMVMQTCEIE